MGQVEKLKAKFLDYYKAHKERTLILGALFLTSLTFLWIFEKPSAPPATASASEPSEMGVNIPKGFLVVPLELANARTISLMMNRMGVIDVFAPGERLLAKNLRILKLNNDENTAFGALVPDKKASQLQSLFANKNLRGALRTLTAEPAQFFTNSSKARIETYNVQE